MAFCAWPYADQRAKSKLAASWTDITRSGPSDHFGDMALASKVVRDESAAHRSAALLATT
jgi:hypothetical protein